MKAAAATAFLTVLIGITMLAAGNDAYVIIPAGEAGPGLFLDRLVPLEGSETLPLLARLPRIQRQPLWAIYEIGESVSGGCTILDENGDVVRSTFIIAELYRLTFSGEKTYYELLQEKTFGCDRTTATYRFELPTDGLEADFYQIRLGLPNGNELDPEFRIQIGDAVFSNEPDPTLDGGCGCGG